MVKKIKRQNVQLLRLWRFIMDREFFDKVYNVCGGIISGGVSLEVVEAAEKKLGVKFSKSYIQYLMTIGSGGANGAVMYGLGDKKIYKSVVEETEKARELYGLEKNYVAVTNMGTKWAQWLMCLDASRMEEEECPIVKFDIEKKEYREYKRNFDELLIADLERVYDKSIDKKCISIEHLNLPLGMGYKACWMMIENASQLEIADVLLKGNKEEKEYKDGLEMIAKASYKDKKVLVTADYKDCNYIIGDAVHDFFHDYGKLRRDLIDTNKAVVYATNRVSNIHAFAYFQHGNLKRMFYFSEEELINEGKEWVEEEQMGLVLPKSFEEMRAHRNDDFFSDIDEEMIVSLAKRQIGIDVEQYPYGNVIVGELNLE